LPQEITKLSPNEENSFRKWLASSQITDADEPDAYYDYRGLFKELKGQPVPSSQGRHFPDTYKQHGHPTFSVESKYSKGPNDGGSWNGDIYMPQKQNSLPSSFQPISESLPESFQPISDENETPPTIVPTKYQGSRLLETLWNKANTPLIQFTPEMKQAMESFGQPGLSDTPAQARIKGFFGGAGEAGVGLLESSSSPLSLGLEAGTFGSGILPTATRGLGKTIAGGTAAHGLYNLSQAEDLPSAASAGVESLIGIGGLRGHLRKLEPEISPRQIELQNQIDAFKRENAELSAKPNLPPELIAVGEEPIVTNIKKDPAELAYELAKKKFGMGASTDVSDTIPKITATKPLADDTTAQIIPVQTPKIPVVEKLRQALGASIPLTGQQLDINKAERAQKFSSARKIKVTDEASARAQRAQLAGAHAKVSMAPLDLEPDDVTEIYRLIGSKTDDQPLIARATKAFEKLRNGEVPQAHETKDLSALLGTDLSEFTSKLNPSGTARNQLRNVAGVTKAMTAGMDFGWHFRQGSNFAGRKAWFQSMLPMMRGYASKDYFDGMQNEISTGKNSTYQRSVGVDFLDAHTPGPREENYIGNVAQHIPGVAASERAQTLAGNKVRHEVFNSMYDDYKRYYDSAKKTARTPDELKSAELLNPDNPYLGRQMAEWVNTGTGRGSLGDFEAAASKLNDIAFSPKLIASRMQTIQTMLNPKTYFARDPVMRKEALKQLASLTGLALTAAGMAKAAGGDVNMDPESSDFLKARIGKTRIDMMGGYQQYMVPMAKLLMGAMRTSTGEKEYKLGHPVFKKDAMDIVGSFAEKKASPLVSFANEWVGGQDITGEKFSFGPSLAKHTIVPMIMKDMYDLYQEDPKLLGLMPLAAMGTNVSVHNK